MDESGMDPGSTPPAPSAHTYMTVPEKIELTSGGIRGGYSSSEPWMNQSTSGYRPMNVPDTITLEQPTAATEGPPRETDQSQASRRITEGMAGEPRPQIQQMEPPKWPHEHQEPQAVIQESPALTDLDRRVRSLEQQVQRLRDVAVNRSVPGETKQRNNVWYVLTFAGWMMIPLIVMYMNRYRR